MLLGPPPPPLSSAAGWPLLPAASWLPPAPPGEDAALGEGVVAVAGVDAAGVVGGCTCGWYVAAMGLSVFCSLPSFFTQQKKKTPLTLMNTKGPKFTKKGSLSLRHFAASQTQAVGPLPLAGL